LKKIIAADDQNINLEVLKSDFAELAISNKVEFASNGQQVIDLVKETFNF
jgi:CheY-like chemotaxis protein